MRDRHSNDRNVPIRAWLTFSTLAFILHFAWEMGQMPAYREMARRPWQASVPRCARAALLDMALSVLVVAPFGLALGRRPRSRVMWLGMAATATAVAIVIERIGLSRGRWSYGGAMPVLPGLGVAVLPILQLGVITPVAARLTLREKSPLSVR